jgi:hypothetical protein
MPRQPTKNAAAPMNSEMDSRGSFLQTQWVLIGDCKMMKALGQMEMYG